MSLHFIKSLLVLLLLCLCFPVDAQPDIPPVLIAAQQENGILLYKITDQSTLELVGSLLEGFALQGTANSDDWVIDEPNNMRVAFDGDRVAFTAQHDNEYALFIYDLTQNTPQQINVPASLVPHWSPDSQFVLLSPFRDPYDEIEEEDKVYLYDPQLQKLTLLFDLFGRDFIWLSDSSGIIFKLGSGDIAYSSRDAKELKMLSHAHTLAPEDAYPYICPITWAETNQRFYYAIGCVGGGDESFEYLYSVGLGGDNKAEMSSSFTSLFPDERQVSVVDILTVRGDPNIYISLRAYNGLSVWRILRLNPDGELDVLYETSVEEEVIQSLISPDGRYIALQSMVFGSSRSSVMEVVDLDTQQKTVDTGGFEYEVCDMEWVDNRHLIYSFEAECQRQITSSREILLTDVATGETTNLTEPLDASVWIIRNMDSR